MLDHHLCQATCSLMGISMQETVSAAVCVCRAGSIQLMASHSGAPTAGPSAAMRVHRLLRGGCPQGSRRLQGCAGCRRQQLHHSRDHSGAQPLALAAENHHRRHGAAQLQQRLPDLCVVAAALLQELPRKLHTYRARKSLLAGVQC